MKYTKLFNNHNEYVAYTGSTAFIRPNVSYCILEEEPHCTPALEPCEEQHIYEIIGEPSYPSTVPASATSFDLSFTYSDTYTATTCEEGSFMDGDTVTIPIEENPSMSARTITGTYVFHDINIPYSFTQEGREELPYNQQYLTFEILTGGTILWKAATTAVARTISYSINNGEWTEITSTTDGVEINVSDGDKIRFKGTNTNYGTAKDTISTFSGSTAAFDAYGNAMSLIGGDDFSGLTSFTADWAFHDLLNTTNVVSAKNLILPVTTLRQCCYRAMFAHAKQLVEAPELPATTLANSGYCYMFQDCTALQKAPDLLAETITGGCYIGMFNSASTLNYIKCTATGGVTTGNTKDWTTAVSNTGTFIRAANVNWTRGVNGVPTNWELYNDTIVEAPVISFNGFETITLSCETEGADILYKLNDTGEYSAYTTPIIINEDTFIEAYATYSGETSRPISQTCQYISTVPIEYSNRDLKKWQYAGQEITTPYSINAIDGHSSSYAKGTFTFETSFALKEAEPTYLWFQHADHSASIYVDDTLVEKHWGGYAAFTSDISEYVHSGINNIKVAIKNNEGNNVAPASGDFNFNATLGNVKLFTSPYVPAMNYGYDGFHITSTVSTGSATINVATSIPTGASVVCTISGVNCNYTATSASTGNEMIFTTTISNPRLWNGKIDPYLYNVKLEIYHGEDLYHRYERPYGFRFYEYVINDTEKVGTQEAPYTGFLLNGAKYLLRGCCMHDDIDGKANALNDTDYANTFATIQELGLNFLRLAHYPHPKEVYDWCDRLGIVVQTEGPCVNKLQSTMPEDYYTHLNTQYSDMVNQHYNHPCILFWGLSNETTTDDKAFGKTKIEGYTSLIKSLDPERWVGYVLAQSPGTSPSAYYNDPAVDWFGCNIYVGWYDSPNSNNPSPQITTRLNNTIKRSGVNKPMAYSEYGCGGTSTCHSDDFMNTTTRGNHERHDIEYQMWLHEGHIAAIKNFPQLLFTSQWQLFDIAVASRNEGYTECLDGVNTSINDDLRRLNNKGLVERDHVTKKDTFYLYKAWWNPTPFVHICQKNYQKVENRVIKCYTNDGNSLTLYVNGTSAETVTVTDNIAAFTARNFNDGDTIMVSGATSNDSFTIHIPQVFCKLVLNNGTTVDITGSGILTSGMTSASTYSATCVSAEIGNLCTSIGKSAFFGFDYLSSVTISNTVTSIGEKAFLTCIALTGITIPDSVTTIGEGAFATCAVLTTAVLPSGITTIEDTTFVNCYKLTSVNIPNGVTSIGNSAFFNCNSLTSIVIPNSVTSIGGQAFRQCGKLTNVVIPDSVTYLGGAFAGCTGLTSVTISSAITMINESTFNACSGLTSITIPSGVTSIGDSAFYYCNGLTGITIPNCVTSIGKSAFEHCINITSITIPSGVTSIGQYCFEDCSGLTSITVDNNNTVYNSRNNCNAIIESSTNTLVVGCKNTLIPSGVTSIGEYAFIGCSGLRSIDIPSGVTSIGESAFNRCSSLTSVTIGNSVTSIGKSAFDSCSSITSIVIPNSVTSIDKYAFYQCTSLASIVSNATTAPTIQSNTFQGIKTGGVLTVPQGSTGYDVWMGTGNYYLGKYNWTKVEQ